MTIDRTKIKIAGLAVVLIGGAAVFYGRPYWRDVNAKKGEIARLTQELNELRSEVAQDTTAARRGNAPMTAAEFQIAVPASSDLGPLLEQISADLKAESVSVRQLEARTIVPGFDFHRIPVALRFEGTFDGLMDLLDRLESGPRVIRIDELIVQGGGTVDAPLPLAVDVRLSTFFQPEGAP